MTKGSKSTGMKIFLGVALAIIFFALFNLGVATFYDGPNYDDYCYNGPVYYDKQVGVVDPQVNCPAVCTPMWKAQAGGTCEYIECGSGCGPDGITTFSKESQCAVKQEGKVCYDVYNEAQQKYDNTLFYIFIIPGLIIAIVGLFIVSLPFQLTTLGAGVALIIEGIIRNLENKIPAFIVGVIVFAILSIFVWRKFKD